MKDEGRKTENQTGRLQGVIEAVTLGVEAMICSTTVQAGMLMRVRARPEFW